MPNPFDLAKDNYYYNAQKKPFKQRDYLDEKDPGFSLSIDITWLSNPHTFWKESTSKKSIQTKSETQGIYKGCGNWNSIAFRKKLNRILALNAGLVAPLEAKFDLKEEHLSSLSSYDAATIQNLFRLLSIQNCGIIFIITKQSDSITAHAFSISSEFDSGILHLRVFDPNEGEILFSYPMLNLHEIMQGYIHEVSDFQDFALRKSIKHFNDFLVDLFKYYQECGYHFYKTYEYHRLGDVRVAKSGNELMEKEKIADIRPAIQFTI